MTDTIIDICRRRPTTLAQLAEAVADLSFMEDVSATVPGAMSLTEDKGLYYPSFTANESSSFNMFMYHCRKTFTENTIRVLFAHFGIAAGYMRSPANALGSKPFDGLSYRSGEPAGAWEVDACST